MDEIQKDLNDLGKNIVKDTKSTVPVRTGKLKNSISYSIEASSLDEFSVTLSEIYYGQYVEKNKFLTNAIEKNLPSAIKSIGKNLTDGILSSITKLNKN